MITVPVTELEKWVMTAYLAGKGAGYRGPKMRIMWTMSDGLWTPALVPE